MTPRDHQPAAKILVTRPLEQAQRFAKQCQARFGSVAELVVSPLMEIRFLKDDRSLATFQRVIFTSANGVRGFVRNWPKEKPPAWCVGKRTAQQAQAAGLATVSGEGTAADLVRRIKAAAPGGRLLHLRGEHARGDVAQRLRAAGLEAEECIIYRQEKCAMTPHARALLSGNAPVILPLFSPRSAALFLEQAQKRTAKVHIVAMSKAVFDELKGSDMAEIVVSPRPTAEGMLDTIAGLMDA